MQLKFLGWVALVFIGAIVVGIGWYVLLPKPAATPVGQQPPVTLPVSGTSTQPVTAAPSSGQMSLPTQTGAAVISKDFLHNGTTIADPSNTGNYYLAVSSPDGFSIGYRTPAQFFTIALEKEPLGQSRQAAEKFLLATLGITQNQLCSLRYYIGTDVHTNSFYAGQNLGFSFCPGAVTLPN